MPELRRIAVSTHNIHAYRAMLMNEIYPSGDLLIAVAVAAAAAVTAAGGLVLLVVCKRCALTGLSSLIMTILPTTRHNPETQGKLCLQIQILG